MDLTTSMIVVYCLDEDTMAGQQLRTRRPQPTLRESEVLTLKVVGEFLGIDTESCRIETAFDQLVQRFHAKRVGARDLWHLISR